MKLKECAIGIPVEQVDDIGHIGHISGFCYNVHVSRTGPMSSQEKRDRAVVMVKWIDGEEYGIHPANIKRLS